VCEVAPGIAAWAEVGAVLPAAGRGARSERLGRVKPVRLRFPPPHPPAKPLAGPSAELRGGRGAPGPAVGLWLYGPASSERVASFWWLDGPGPVSAMDVTTLELVLRGISIEKLPSR